MTEWYQYKVLEPFLWAWGQIVNHSGIDYGAPCGTPITSPVDATVLNSSVKPWGGQIDLSVASLPGYSQGPHVLTFLHSSAQYVTPGQQVSRGQVLGLSGQPPPGAGYGGGCHVHFEVTHGTTAPYTTYSPGRNPTSASYPESPAPLIANLPRAGFAGTVSGAPLAVGSNCGPPPDVTNTKKYPGGTFDPQYIIDANAWINCVNGTPGKQNPIIGAGGIGNPFDVVTNFFSWIKNNVIRVAKFVVGLNFILLAMLVAFLPEVLGAGLATAGMPGLAGVVRSGRGGGSGLARGILRGAGQAAGRQRAATGEERVRQRAETQARTLNEQQDIAIQHAATTRNLRKQAVQTLHTARASQRASTRALRTAAQSNQANQRANRQAPLIPTLSPTPSSTPAPTQHAFHFGPLRFNTETAKQMNARIAKQQRAASQKKLKEDTEVRFQEAKRNIPSHAARAATPLLNKNKHTITFSDIDKAANATRRNSQARLRRTIAKYLKNPRGGKTP
jgi:murein DD-endopeptidase MepM/ murein hydrolase activator NlpD